MTFRFGSTFVLLALALTAVAAAPRAQDVLSEDEEARPELAEAPDVEATSGLRVSTICTNCNAATLTMNGLQADHVRVFWDGIPVTGGLATVHALTQFPDALLGHVAVSRGPWSVLTGDSGLGGSIDLHPAERDQQRLLLRGEVGSEDWRQLVFGGTESWERVGGLVFLQGAQSDSWDSNSDGFNDVAEFDRLTGLGILDFELTEYQRLVLGLTVYDEEQVDGPGPPVVRESGSAYLHEDVDLHWREASLSWRLRRPSGLALTVNARRSWRDQVQSAPFDFGQPYEDTFDIEDRRDFLAASLEAPVGRGFLSAALEYEEITLAVDQLFHAPNAPSFIEDSLRHRAALVEWNRGLGGRWDLVLGARFDEYVTYGESDGPRSGFESAPRERHEFLSPRGRLSWRPRDEVVLSASIGRGTIGPRPVFEQTCCGARYQRSLDLEPERGWSAELRAEWRPRSNQRVVATLFHSDFDDYHERIVFQSEAGIVYWKKAALPRARVQGFEIAQDLRLARDRLVLGWSYTHVDSEVVRAFQLASPEAAEDWDCRDHPLDPAAYPLVLDEPGSELRYTPRHVGSLSVAWDDPLFVIEMGLSEIYTGGMRHFLIGTPGEPTALAATTRGPCTPWAFQESESFWTVDLGYEQRLGSSGWSLHAAVENVFDYTLPDLGELDSAYDWGPLQGRFVRVGASWRR